MKTAPINSIVEAVFGSKHKGHRGVVLNCNGDFLTVRAIEPKSPFAHKSNLYGEDVFYIDKQRCKLIKDKS